MAYADRTQYAERGFTAGCRAYHKYDCQHGKGKAYQHGNADKDLWNSKLWYFRCDRVRTGVDT